MQPRIQDNCVNKYRPDHLNGNNSEIAYDKLTIPHTLLNTIHVPIHSSGPYGALKDLTKGMSLSPVDNILRVSVLLGS